MKPLRTLSIKSLFGPLVCLALVSCGGGGGGGPAPEPALIGALTPDCGAGCAAVNGNTYSGSGIGVWRFNNTSGADVSFNVNIAGVAAGKTATLVFSNGSQATASAPSSGVLASPVTPEVTSAAMSAEAGGFAGAAAEQASHDDAHTQMLDKNRAVANGLMRLSGTTPAAASDLAGSLPGVARLSFSPAVGADKTWIDNFPATPVPYATKAQFVCALPTGRNVVWWVDPNIVTSGKFTQSALNVALKTMQDSYCGASGSGGGLAQLNTLLGDVWGSAAARFVDVIHDTPSLQDVNVVLLNVPASSGWAGYFAACNNLLKAECANVSPGFSSNEALAFFINAEQIRRDLDFATSTLLHESTHMVNFYQRGVVRNVIHDTWLEETSAMMTEDIVAPAVIRGGYNKIMNVRLPDYMKAGGNVSYLNWPTLQESSSHYGMGGGFGAFLNRRYGLAIYTGLVTTCSDSRATSTAAARTSYDCLDELIKANKGVGFSDEFSRFGATVFGQLPAAGAPAGYGYPGVQAGAYALQANDLSASKLAAPVSLASGYTATSQTYQRDTIAFGKTSYVRNGVLVPAHTTLTLTIK
jgi:Peptidase M30